MAPNIPAMFEAHFGIPLAGAVINALNTRLDPASVAFMLQHAEAKVLFTDRELSPTVSKALRMLEKQPLVIDIDDPLAGGEMRSAIWSTTISSPPAMPDFQGSGPEDEWDAIALNYTSGTTGNPKGRRAASSRRVSQCGEQYRHLGDAALSGVPVDVADVSLQWLVLSVDSGAGRRHQRVPAQSRAGTDFRSDPRAPRHAFLRRARRAQHADQCAGYACALASSTRCTA